MKKKLLSAVLAASMIFTMSGMSVLASTVETAIPAERQEKSSENLLKLWYDKPASQGTTILSAGGFNTTAEDNQWQQLTLPIGNSYMGANVYGEIASERLTFNQKTLWNGGPSDSRLDYNGGNQEIAYNGQNMSDVYDDVVDAFLNGDSNASSMCNYLTGDSAGYGAYQSWGDIYLTFAGLEDSMATEGYERNLDMTEGIANVDFTANGTAYHREYFVSYPDNVLAMKLTASGNGMLNLNVAFPVDNEENVTASNLGKDVTYTVDAASASIVTAGEMQDNQMKLNSKLQIVTEGNVTANADGDSLDISGADEVIIYVAADTDYANDYPTYRTGESDSDLAANVAAVTAAAVTKGYDGVKASHLADYQELFDRLDLDLGQAVSDKATDALLAAYTGGSASESEKRLLEVLLYQYGRYLTIESSRDGDLPANLQGVWQNRVGDAGRVPWGSDYHMNVNLQMNYWPTYSSNLSECAIPLIDYVDSLREPGRVTAETYYGIASEEGETNGFTAHTQNTPFGWTCPGWDFSWGWSPAAVPWILQNCWEYFEYTGDVEFMKERIYPMLKEEAVLYDQILVDSGVEITLADGTKSTRLVSAPTYSPEHGPRTLGNAYEQELIWQLYEDVITAAETLGVDADLVEGWKETQSRLSPIEVGDSGQIKEWYSETTLGSLGSRQHRHMSHLLGLFPGDLISVDNDEYMDAAIISLTDRGMSSTGWGMGQRLNAWARTGQGEKAYQLIETLFEDGIYPNLWDSHAPFQIDGNFGYTSGVNEMLMQSNMGYINVLPALPSAWIDGSVDGIVARGNFELDIEWTNGTADSVEILSNNGGECAVQYTGISSAVVRNADNEIVEYEILSRDRISFDTVAGETYTVTEFEDLAAAPENGTADWYGGDSVDLSWDAVEGAESYIIYRQEDGDYVEIADGITETSYIDTLAITDTTAVKYCISAVVDGNEGKYSDTITLTELTTRGYIDDQNSAIIYTGDWNNWTDTKHYNGTIKYNEDGTEGDSIEMTFGGTGIDVIVSKNPNFGIWEIELDGESLGRADAYALESLARQTICSITGLKNGKHTIKLIATGTHNENSKKAKLEFDAFIVYGPDIVHSIAFSSERTLTSGSLPELTTGAAGSTITLPECDAKITGYILSGWSDGKNTYKPGAEYTVTGKDVTLEAVWIRGDMIELSKEGWEAIAGSEEGISPDGPASWAIDGNTSTHWHSNWSGASNLQANILGNERNEFTINFHKDITASIFEYLPRQDGGRNGIILEGKLYYSTTAEGEDFQLLAEVSEENGNKWEEDKTAKQIDFGENITMHRIQFRATGTIGDIDDTFISAAEFSLYTKSGDEIVEATGVTADEAMTLAGGESRQLNASVTPENATYKELVYSTSNYKLATVDKTGRVTANKLGRTGEVVITVSTEDGLYSAECIVTVTDLKVNNVIISQETAKMMVGGKVTLTAVAAPYYANDKSITWNSSDESVATVADGVVTAIGSGSAEIKASSENEVFAICTVTVGAVEKPITGIEVEKTHHVLGVSKTYTIKATVLPDDATASKEVTFQSSNEDVAIVSEEGVVTGKAAGTAVITVASVAAPDIKVEVTIEVAGNEDIANLILQKTEEAAALAETAKEAAEEAAKDAAAAEALAEAAKAEAQKAAEAAVEAQVKAENAQKAAEEVKKDIDASEEVIKAAENAATTAAKEAESAQTKAEDAATAAGAAADRAEIAKAAAETAQEKAETAQTAAETAKDAAETAKVDAEAAKAAAEAAAKEAAAASQAAVTAGEEAKAAKEEVNTAKNAAEAARIAAEAANISAASHAAVAEAARDEAKAAAEAAKEALAKAEEILAKAQKEAEEKLKAAQETLEKAEALKKQMEDLIAKSEFKASTVSLKSVKSAKKKTAKVIWKKAEGAEGYVIQYAANTKFKKAKTVTVKKAVAQKLIRKLNSGKKYYVRVKAYRTFDGQKVYTKYSRKRAVRVK